MLPVYLRPSERVEVDGRTTGHDRWNVVVAFDIEWGYRDIARECVTATTGYERVANIQPPLQLNSLAGTYASSAYVAAAKQGKKELDQLAEDVTSFAKTLRDDAQLKAKIGTSLRAC